MIRKREGNLFLRMENTIHRLRENFFSRNFIFYFALYFISYYGLATYFVSLSPFVIEKFSHLAQYIFLAGQIGYPAGYFFTGWLSDKTRKIRALGIAFSIALIPSQYLFFSGYLDFWGTFVFAAILRFLFASLVQIVQIATLEVLHYNGFSVSRMGGTLGFFFMQITMFLVEVTGSSENAESSLSRGGMWGSFIHVFTLLLVMMTLPEKRKSQNPYYFAEVFRITVTRKYWVFLLVSFFYYFSYQSIDYYLGAYFLKLGGMEYVYAGWILGVILEIPFFPLTQLLIQKYGLKSLFSISLFAGVVRFFLLFLHSVFQGGSWILLSQILHGIHFTGYMAGSIYFFHKKYPQEYNGTAFGIFIVFSLSLGASLGSLLYGIWLQQEGYPFLFWISFLNHAFLLLLFFYSKNVDRIL